jgi:hypothetical protein
MKKALRTLLFATPFAVFFLSFFHARQVQSYSFRPPTGRTQDPVNNSTCAASGCHDSWAPFALDRAIITIGTHSGNQQPLNGFQFTPGTQYLINFTIIGTANRYGFQISALRGNANAGTFASINSNTFVQTQNGIAYIGHQSASSSVSSWSFNWTAPSTGSGNIVFYTAVNKAYSPSGDANDSIFHRTYIITPAPVLPPVVSAGRDTAICAGNAVQLSTIVSGAQGSVSYTWQPSAGLSCTNCPNPVATPAQTTSYIVTATAANGSASDTVVITVNPSPSATISGNNFVCNGNSITLTASGGTNYSWNQGLGSGSSKIVSPATTTTYVVTVTNAANCSATAAKTVEVRNSSSQTIQQTICQGSSYFFKGQNLTQPGTYRDTLLNTAGCDSFIVLNLSVQPPLQSSFNQSICQGGSFFFNGQNLTQPGTYKDTVTTAAGCDSIITLHLTINSTVEVNLMREICEGDSVLFKGIARKTSGVFADTSQALGGCDSITTLTLIVNSRPTANAGSDKTVSALCDVVGVLLGGFPTATGHAPFTYSWSPQVGLNFTTSSNPVAKNIPATTTYTVTVTDKNNCTATSSVVVNTIDLTAPILQNGNVLAAPQTYSAYQWLKNGIPIPGATDSVFTVTETGNYSLLAQGPDGCTDTSNVVSITIAAVGDYAQLSSFNVFPNPAIDQLHIVFGSEQGFSADIFNIHGEWVQTISSAAGKTVVDISHLDAGFYFIKIRNELLFIRRFCVIK